jgi:siroheme decarboxylase
MPQPEAAILARLQQGLPLVPEPFQQLAAELTLPADQLRAHIARLRDNGVIREISGIFDAARLGYAQTLAAFRIPPEHLAQAGAIVAEHPGIGHAYSRADEWNLWCTLAVGPDSSLGLAGTADRLARLTSAEAHMLLPTVRRYKLHVRFGSDDALAAPTPPADPPGPVTPPSDLHRRAVRALQQDLPAEPNPFEPLAAAEGLSAADLLVAAADLLARGALRRYAAVVNHRAAGARANVLVAWTIPPDRVDLAGAAAAAHPAVSHCYLRSAPDHWPWKLFTMIHAAEPDQAQAAITHLQQVLAGDRRELWTAEEFKKARPQFFSPAEAQWEHQPA